MPGSKGNDERSAELQQRAESGCLLAQEWLSKSGAFAPPDDKRAAAGSVSWGYDVRRRTWRHAYTEMAGYALTFFLRLRKWRRDPSFLEYAKHVGEYLISIQAKEGPQAGAFPHSVSFPQGEASKWHFSFDTAICLAALSELYIEAKEEKWLKAAEAAAKWLIEQAHKPDGSFRSGFDASRRTFDPQVFVNSFCGDGSPIHSKAALAFLRFFQATSEPRFLLAAHKAVSYALSFQPPAGFFPVAPKRKWVFTHAHCYAAEAACFLHFKTGDRRALAGFELATDWLLSHQTRTGGMRTDYNRFRSVHRLALDATAQAARLFLIRYSIGNDENYLEAAEAAVEFILSLQRRKESEPSCHGGFFSGRLVLPLAKPRFATMTTWGTLFAAHALHSYATPAATAEELADELF